MASGFKINQQAVRKMTRELQKSFDRETSRHPVTIRARFEPGAAVFPVAGNVTNYNGPVVTVNGDHSQIAWGNHNVTQGQASTSPVTPGYEQLAAVITDLLANLPALGLGTEDDTEVRNAADTVLAEVVEEEPNQGVIKRGVIAIKGHLAQFITGTVQAVTDESTEIARQAIDGLSTALPF